MTPETYPSLAAAAAQLAPWTKSSATPEANRLDLTLAASDLPAAVKQLHTADWGYLAAITGLDLGPAAGEMEALYHFCAGPHIVTLRVRTPRAEATVPSICDTIAYADLYERELMEMYGITVANTPDPSRLFISEDWPAGVYPMRKDFNPAIPQPYVAAPHTASGEKFVVPIGPQHPALKEPGRFEFTVEGETVTGATVRLGYVHRGLEKACEERTWIQDLYLLERVCGICSHHHAYAYTLAVEQLAKVEVPLRAQVIRELVAGLERIHSHLLWLGVAAHQAGFDTLFMYSWRDREQIMDTLEQLTGNRVNYSANVLGGVKFDVSPEQIALLHKTLDFLQERTKHYQNVIMYDETFRRRTRGVATLSLAQAKELGVVGPTARASGLTRDIRVEAPYGSYTLFPMRAITETAGDLEARFSARLKELFESYKTIHGILDKLPPGELAARFPRRIPAGEAISRVEAPRGELFYFVKSNGSDKPERVKARTPSMCNFASVIKGAIGHQLADIPLIIAGIDPCFSCNDRMIVVRQK